GGALMNQAIHSVDLLQWYMGPVKSVQAVTANRRHKDIEVEDTAVAILRFENGAVGTIECTTAAFPGSFKRLEIMGTKGTVIIEENDLRQWDFKEETPGDVQIRENFMGAQLSKGGVSNPMDISYLGHKEQIMDLMTAISNDSIPLI